MCKNHIYVSVHGGWSEWTEFNCTDPCGGAGFQNFTRVCDSPAPDHGGEECQGEDLRIEDCNRFPCPSRQKRNSLKRTLDSNLCFKLMVAGVTGQPPIVIIFVMEILPRQGPAITQSPHMVAATALAIPKLQPTAITAHVGVENYFRQNVYLFP